MTPHEVNNDEVLRRFASCIGAVMCFFAASVCHGQSLDRLNPAPLVAGVNKGSIDNSSGPHFYYFWAQPGHFDVRMAVEAVHILGFLPLPQVLSFDFFDESGKLLSHNTVMSALNLQQTTTNGESRNRQKVILSIAQEWFLRHAGHYEVEITGAADFGGSAEVTAEPAPKSAEDSECDALAGSRFDQSRPPGVKGVELEQIDVARALPVCSRALSQNPSNPRLQYQLGRIYDRQGTDRETVHLFRLAADQGYAVAQYDLGVFYHFGILFNHGKDGLVKDDHEAARLFRLAADRQYAPAQTALGLFCDLGLGGSVKDDHEAARLFRLAADQQYAQAQIALGLFYEQGRGGLTKDDHEAARLYNLAADQGNVMGQAFLGSFYAEGRGGLTKDDHEAARLYRLAADQGNAMGQVFLGSFYAEGRGGLTKDDHEAARLYRLAADRGNAVGQVFLGSFYAEGRGELTNDDGEAVRLFRLAADQGYAAGLAWLGFFTEQGRGGLTKDNDAAALLYWLAAYQGYAWAKEKLGSHEQAQGGVSSK
jgi:TPR repeat protein